MAYIVPNTDIVLCRDVPLDSSYDHTVDFADANAQWAYFYSKRYKVISANSYQRVLSGRLRIECTMEEAIQCNYLYFRNNNFEDKFIYAFITGWYYVNNITTEISYEIDVFQTFWFDVRLLQVFVEREHDNTDTYGANTIEEDIELGEYVVNGTNVLMPTGSNQHETVIFLTTFKDDETCSDFTGGYASHVWTGLLPIKKETTAEVTAFIQKAISNNKYPDGIIAAFMCPWNPQSYDVEVWTMTIPKKAGGTLNGYTPKNNKLYCYPYNLLHVRTDVDSADFRYELFSGVGNNCVFTMYGCIVPEPSLILIPASYKQYGAAFEYRMALKNFPQVAINGDVLKVYLAQNAASLPTSMISQAANAALGVGKALATGGLSPTAGYETVSALSQITGTIAKLKDISTKPPQQKGTQTTLDDYATGAKTFYADNLCQRAEILRVIDDYFDMFGYATHRIKQPNITGRPYWNYVKTIGNTVDALGVPDPYLKEMNNAFNKGITFWHNPNNVGTYSLDNRPV